MAGAKNQENTQFGRVDDGTGNSTSGPQLADTGREPLVDAEGRQIVQLADPGGFVSPGTLVNLLNNFRLPTVGSIASAVPVLLMESIFGYNANLVALQFLHLFNSAVLPTNGVTVPDYVLAVQPNFTSFTFSGNFRFFTTGLVVAPSSVEFVYTTPAAADFSVGLNIRV